MPRSAAPVVSVILPSFNRPALLRRAIASVFAQTLTDWELVVADDGSSSETRSYLVGLDDARVRILWLPHTGNPAIVRNAALAKARGTYVAFLDSDDTWMPTKLETQLAALSAKPTCGWSYTATERVDADGHPLPNGGTFIPYEGSILEACLRDRAHIALSTVLALRTLVNEVGAFDEQQGFAEDYDLWLRLAARSPAVPVDQALTRVCLHQDNDNDSPDRLGLYRGWIRLYDKLLPTIRDPPTIALCQRRRAEAVLHLANRQANLRQAFDLARTVLQYRNCAPHHPEWRRETTRALVRSLTPLPLLNLYRRLRPDDDVADSPDPASRLGG
jgi:glycosyltransferase involved in cell wall biosynthesis